MLLAICCMMSIDSSPEMLKCPPMTDPTSTAGAKFYPYRNLPIKEY